MELTTRTKVCILIFAAIFAFAPATISICKNLGKGSEGSSDQYPGEGDDGFDMDMDGEQQKRTNFFFQDQNQRYSDIDYDEETTFIFENPENLRNSNSFVPKNLQVYSEVHEDFDLAYLNPLKSYPSDPEDIDIFSYPRFDTEPLISRYEFQKSTSSKSSYNYDQDSVQLYLSHPNQRYLSSASQSQSNFIKLSEIDSEIVSEEIRISPTTSDQSNESFGVV